MGDVAQGEQAWEILSGRASTSNVAQGEQEWEMLASRTPGASVTEGAQSSIRPSYEAVFLFNRLVRL